MRPRGGVVVELRWRRENDGGRAASGVVKALTA